MSRSIMLGEAEQDALLVAIVQAWRQRPSSKACAAEVTAKSISRCAASGDAIQHAAVARRDVVERGAATAARSSPSMTACAGQRERPGNRFRKCCERATWHASLMQPERTTDGRAT